MLFAIPAYFHFSLTVLLSRFVQFLLRRKERKSGLLPSFARINVHDVTLAICLICPGTLRIVCSIRNNHYSKYTRFSFISISKAEQLSLLLSIRLMTFTVSEKVSPNTEFAKVFGFYGPARLLFACTHPIRLPGCSLKAKNSNLMELSCLTHLRAICEWRFFFHLL